MTQHSHDTNEFKLRLNETSEHDEKERLRCQENKDENSTVIQQGQEWIRTVPNFRCKYTEDEIIKMGMLGLTTILNENKTDFDHLETRSEMRDLILFNMKKRNQSIEQVIEATSMDKVFSTAASQQGAEAVDQILETDLKRKQSLYGIYGAIEKLVSYDNFECTLKEEMTTEFGDILSRIISYKEELIDEQCPIVVAGEAGAGKSSLINLLLGSDILPQSLLTSTYTMCRIWNKEERAVYLTDLNDDITKVYIPSDPALMKETLHKCVNKEGHSFKYVDIHLPFPILKSNTIIVDTSGIGSSEELTMRLLDYLPKAIAFIYVINSSNAGGVQSDRLLKIFEMQKSEGMKYDFDPTTAIFVCNKWDQVPDSEDKLVWDHILREIQNNWPNFKDSQMFRLSVKEETRRASIHGLEYTSNFMKLLTAISEMITASLEAKAARHARWQNQFLEKALKRIEGRIKLSRKTENEKKILKFNIEERIIKLSYNIKKVRERVKEEAKYRCVQISTNLHKHLMSVDTYKNMFSWSNAELPKAGDFELIEYQAKKLIIERINTETRAWCNREKINDITQELSNLFKAECKLIDTQGEDIKRILSMPLDEGLHDNSYIPNHSKDPLFTKQEKFVFAVTFPLWLPLVIGAGMIALPFGVAAGVKNLVQHSWKINDYKSNRLEYMMDWCSDVLKQYNKEAILKLMEETYLKDFNMKVDFVCETSIPQQLKADEQFIGHINNELRTSCEIRKQFQPLEFSCKGILGKFLLINMDYFSGYKLPKKNIRDSGEKIGEGQYSDVHATEVLINDKWVKAAVKTPRKPLERIDSYVKLSVVQNLRKLDHQNIVEFFGVSYRRGSQSEKFLQIYMEYCDGSLEHIVYRKRYPPPCFKFKDVSLCKESWEFYLKMMCGVCKGLIHVHNMGFVHRDLKLANILVKDGEAKIADIGLAKEAEDILGTVIGTPTTMAPEVLQEKMYGTEADIFSLGIILWEMWYARPGYTHPVGVESEGFQFIAKNLNELSKYVINGIRPELATKYRPHNKLQFLMKKCWDNNIANRPTAADVFDKLSEMKS